MLSHFYISFRHQLWRFCMQRICMWGSSFFWKIVTVKSAFTEAYSKGNCFIQFAEVIVFMTILDNHFLRGWWQISESRESVLSSCFVYYGFPSCLLADWVTVCPNLNKGIPAVGDASYAFTFFEHCIAFAFSFPTSGMLDVFSYHIVYYLSCVGLWNEQASFDFWLGQGFCYLCLSPRLCRFSRSRAPVWGVQDDLSSKDKSAGMWWSVCGPNHSSECMLDRTLQVYT